MSQVEKEPLGLSEEEKKLLNEIESKIINLLNEKKYTFIPTWEQYELATSESDFNPKATIYSEIADLVRGHLEETVNPLSDRPYKFKETLRKPGVLESLFENIRKNKNAQDCVEKSDQTVADPDSKTTQIR